MRSLGVQITHPITPDYVEGVCNVFLRKTSNAEKRVQGTTPLNSKLQSHFYCILNFLHPRSPPSDHIFVTFSLHYFLLVPSMFTATFLYSSSASGPFTTWIVSNSIPSICNGLFSLFISDDLFFFFILSDQV